MYKIRLIISALFLFMIPTMVNAQNAQNLPVYTQVQLQQMLAQNTPVYTQAQLQQMLAPIALYPDPLVAQILMASTYPLEVVQADRWLDNPQNAALKGDALAVALQQQPWDASVKSLVPFPQIIKTMDENLQWTEQLGDAFLAQQPAVMDAVQELRRQAQANGTLKSTPQQVVSSQGQAIVIQPENPEIVYVPDYNPIVVYGTWQYPAYPPFYFPAPFGFAYDGALIGFGIGLPIIGAFWGWDTLEWGHHHIDVDNARFSRINNGRPGLSSGIWQHNPEHRHGVPYSSAQVRSQFQQASDKDRRNYRGYNSVAIPHAVTTQLVRPNAGFSARGTSSAQVTSPVSHQERLQRSASPIFESFPQGSKANSYGMRGASSRTNSSFSLGRGGRGGYSGHR